jgi:soluble lytic murein transglycosylase
VVAATSPVTFSPVSDGRATMAAIFPEARITSGYRGPDHPLSRANPRSYHTRTRAAVDLAPIPGMTFEQAKARIEQAGYGVIEALNETGSGRSRHATGDHWHFVLGRR